MAAMMNQNDYMNNPFAYLIWMIFAMRMWNNQDGNQGNAIQSQLDAMRSQIAGKKIRLMAFKDVKQNYSVYILNKQDITITDGKVISVGFPHLDLSTKPAMGQSQMVVDVTIEANSKTATYSIPENLSVTYAGDVVLSTDKQGLMAEVEQMKNTAEKILESVPKQKEVVDKTTVLLSELNPVYKEKKGD